MKHVSWILALVVGFVLGMFTAGPLGLGSGGARRQNAPAPSIAAAPRPRPTEDPKAVYRAPIDGSPVKGPADALVTVVESSDFQCPFCKRVAPTLKQLEEAYPGKLRWVFKNNPLVSIHPLAMGSALAAEAARDLGGDTKFWEMHDELFAISPQLDPAALEAAARKLGLDVERFKAAMAAGTGRDSIERDQKLVTSLGAGGTPAFFINGRKLSGAQPLEAFKAVVDEELKKAEALVRSGTPAGKVYEAIIARGATAPVMRDGQAEAAAPSAPAAPPPSLYRKVPLRPDDPVRGPAQAPLTVVVFSDFQCPFCSRVEPTLKKVEQTYGAKVRFVWKHQPLPMHPNAMPAAIAAEAAREQGKFWEMHDKLFAQQADLSPATYERYAGELGLDLGKFKAAVAARSGLARIAADQQLAGTVGANGTPTLFFNCRQLVGAVPFETMSAVIDEELRKADGLLKGQKPGASFYEQACDANLALAAAEPAPAPAQRQAEPAAPPPTVDAGALSLRRDDPARGSAKAPVTLVLFSDFQCPFCGRVEPTLAEVERSYGDKVRVVWKHQPLPMHPNAMPAAIAAEAAREQGKFWEMHDKLFQNQQALSPAVYTQLAKELGLDLARFDADRQSDKTLSRIKEDQALAGRMGVNGTPTMFVNGERVVGAVQFDALKPVIDRQLARR